MDSNFKRFARPFSGYAGSLFNFFARGGSAARTELSQATRTGASRSPPRSPSPAKRSRSPSSRQQGGCRGRDLVRHGVDGPRVPEQSNRRRPIARRVAARDSHRGEGGMSDLGACSFLPWLRQGLASRIRNADLDPSVQSRVQVDVQLTVRGPGSAGASRLRRSRGPSRSSAPATSSASTAARSCASSRATGSRTSSRITSRTSSSTTRTFRGATRPRRPTRRRDAFGHGSRCSCSRRTSSPTASHRRRAAAIDRGRESSAVSPRR